MHDQASSLRCKLSLSKNTKHAKTIAIVSGKGGVGKSNVALNFSLELISHNKTVLLFDLDVGMGNVDILLGLQAEKSIVDMFNDSLPIHDIMETGPKNLSYIAAGSGLTDFFTLDQEKMEYFLEQYDDLVQMYDYIIFDMGAGVSGDSLQFVMAADECIVVTTPEPTAITDAYGMIKHIVNNKRNLPIYVVMNQSSSMKQGRTVLERFKIIVSRFLQVDIHPMGVLPFDKTVRIAVARQVPFVMLNEKSAISKAIKQITSDYLTNSFDLSKNKAFSFVQRIKQIIER